MERRDGATVEAEAEAQTQSDREGDRVVYSSGTLAGLVVPSGGASGAVEQRAGSRRGQARTEGRPRAAGGRRREGARAWRRMAFCSAVPSPLETVRLAIGRRHAPAGCFAAHPHRCCSALTTAHGLAAPCRNPNGRRRCGCTRHA